MLHPSEWAKMTPGERLAAAYRGDLDSGIHWKIVRVARIFGINAEELHNRVERHDGWEPHDPGYTHKIVQAADDIRATRRDP